MRKTGSAEWEAKRDAAVEYFHVENPLHTEEEIGEAFGLDEQSISCILKKQKEMRERENDD